MKDNYNAEYYFKEGERYSLIGDYNKALKYLDKAIDLDKTYREGYVEKGRVYCNLGDYYNQIKLHTQELRIFGCNKDDENNKNSYLNRANCYIILRQ